jgi:hypothetical protein
MAPSRWVQVALLLALQKTSTMDLLRGSSLMSANMRLPVAMKTGGLLGNFGLMATQAAGSAVASCTSPLELGNRVKFEFHK